MSKVHLSKVRIIGLRKHQEAFLQHIHRLGIVHIAEDPYLQEQSPERTVGVCEPSFRISSLEFALQYLAPYAPLRSKWDQFLSGGKMILEEKVFRERIQNLEPKIETILAETADCEEQLIREANEKAKIPVLRKIVTPLRDLQGEVLEDGFDTEQTKTWIGAVSEGVEKTLMKEISAETNLVDIQILSKANKKVFLRITAMKSHSVFVEGVLGAAKFKFFDWNQLSDFFGKSVTEIKDWCDQEEARITAVIQALEKKRKELALHTEDLKLYYDYELWNKARHDATHHLYTSDRVFALEGWMVASRLTSLTEWVAKAFAGEVALEAVEPQEGEVAPALLHNPAIIKSYEPIVSMFGLPGGNDIDPTLVVAPFFFVFFGLCLSDVGYGSILTLASLFFLLFGKFTKAAKHSLALLLLCGIGAIIGGVILGGYFGIEVSQAPAFLVNSDTGMFKGQLFQPLKGSGPMTFLFLALGMGVLHLLVGVLMDGVKKICQKDYTGALFDSAAWFFLLLSLALFGVSGSVEALDGALWGKCAIIGAVILIVTQGRSTKNWFMKPIVGVLSLYGATSYLSDLLSYARIMALGLATGVVGSAMNLTAGVIYDMIPVSSVALIAAGIVILCGHGLNFALSVLGAFIHSGRLQFIEFFGKFYDAGGVAFAPFGRAFKYVRLKEEKESTF